MFELPMVKELIADGERVGQRRSIIRVLVARFGPGARDMRHALDTIEDDKKLDEVADLSATCPDLESFKKGLGPQARKRK
jgi:hypothetical protein